MNFVISHASKKKFHICVALFHCSVCKLTSAAKIIRIRPVHPKVLYSTIDLVRKKEVVLRKQGAKFGNIGANGHLGDFKGRQLRKFLWYSCNILQVIFGASRLQIELIEEIDQCVCPPCP